MKQVNRRRGSIALAAFLAAGVWASADALDLPLTPVPSSGASVQVVASGLDDPRGLAFGPDGGLYVAEAGTTESVFVGPPPPPPQEPPTRTRCEIYWPVGPATPGYTGRISRVGRAGDVSVIASGLPSFAANMLIGGDRLGVAAVAFRGSKLYAVVNGAGCSHGHPSEPNALHRVLGDGTTVPLADLSNFLRSNTDSKDPAAPDFEPDGTWFNLVRAFGAFYMTDPNHGVLVRVENNGAITRVADLYDAVRQLDGDGDRTYSALTQHKGAFYVGTLGRIDDGFAGAVYRVARDGSNVRQVARGLHGVLGIAFDRQGRLYALETTAPSAGPPLSDPSLGRLVRVERDGSLTPIVTNLSFPTALIVGPRGDFYVSNCGYHCDDTSRIPLSRPSLRTGQVLRICISDGASECDE
jgi:hypothetical protein